MSNETQKEHEDTIVPISDRQEEPISDEQTEPISDLQEEPISDLQEEPISDLQVEPISDGQIVSDPKVETITEPTESQSEIDTTTSEVFNEQEFNLDMIDQSMTNVSSGQIVDGTVVSVDDKDVLVDIGCKSESPIPLHEFAPDNIPVKGDIIKVYVISRESSDGKPFLSKRRADLQNNITKMKEAYQNN